MILEYAKYFVISSVNLEEIFLLSFSVPFNYNYVGGILFATRRYDIVTVNS